MNRKGYMNSPDRPATSARKRDTNQGLAYKSANGQATVMVALCAIALVAMVGLAIDGGSAYAQRRTAQNSADAAAMAATRVMLDRYMEMVAAYPYEDVDGSAETDDEIRSTIDDYAHRHGIDPSALQAYYVTDSKQVIGDGDNLVEVGNMELVPWTEGAKGIWVKNRAETNTFFMKIIGWSKVGATASSTAFMGPTVQTSSDLGMLPIGLFTSTNELDDLVIGQNYILIEGDSRRGDGNWGYLDYNQRSGGGSAVVNQAWVHCGFNPTVTTGDRWTEWANSQGSDCADNYSNPDDRFLGMTAHYKCLDPEGDPSCSQPEDTITYVPYVKYGLGTAGWWIGGSTGSVRQSCDDIADLVNGTTGYHFNVPIIDSIKGDSGMNDRFHLLSIGRFLIQNVDIECHIHGNDGDHSHWHIDGIYEGFYLDGTGHHGDIRHASANTVFLDN